MAEGPNETPAFSFRRAFLWTEIFRSFQVALDPRKLLVAAAGILVMSLGWYLLSVIFYKSEKPQPNEQQYSAEAMKKGLGDKKANGADYTAEEYKAAGQQEYERDLARWRFQHNLAGPGGLLRTLPWYEYRGPNPFLLVSTLVGGNRYEISDTFEDFLVGTVPVLVEPLRKQLLPVLKLFDPNASTLTRIYLILVLLWTVATWAFFGGVITRIAAVQFAGKERITLSQAVRFVLNRYTSYVLSPIVPLGVILVIVIALALYGLVAMIPILGDFVLYGLGLPLVLIGGVAIAVLLVGLVGYPMMFTTISAEGSDTFDALSRSYNYVFQAPWSYLWYSFVAVVYGAVVTLFVVFMASLAVYAGKWAISQAPGSESAGRKPDFLFIYSPESFGWKELLLAGSPAEQKVEKKIDEDTGRQRVVYVDANPEAAETYRKSLWGIEKGAAGMVTFWMVLVLLLVIGFAYSYFWSSATMVYLLMRKKVDETELDEVYVEEEQPEAPYSPPVTTPTTPAPSGTAPASLPMVPPPAVPPTPAPSVTQVPLPPVGQSVTIGTTPTPPVKTDDGKVGDTGAAKADEKMP